MLFFYALKAFSISAVIVSIVYNHNLKFSCSVKWISFKHSHELPTKHFMFPSYVSSFVHLILTLVNVNHQIGIIYYSVVNMRNGSMFWVVKCIIRNRLLPSVYCDAYFSMWEIMVNPSRDRIVLS